MNGTSLARLSAWTTLVLTGGLVLTWPSSSVSPSSSPSSSSVSPNEPTTAHPHHPVRLSLAPRIVGDRLTLSVRLERSSLYSALPARLELRLPAGATLLRGDAEVDLPAGPVVAHEVELRIDGVPAEDLVAVVAITGEGRTARGEAHHRFGRPEPRLPDMPRLPEARVRGGGSLGTRIRVTPLPR